MHPRQTALRFAVTLIACFVFAAHPAAAAQTPAAEADYATVLRTINPELQVHQSLAYARSLLADSRRTQLDPNLIVALVTVESSWRPGAVSPSGARGLGQLMPTTAARLGINPGDPAQNLRGASAYLRSLVNRFAGRGLQTIRLALGAYNAGPLAVERAGINGSTLRYVSDVLTRWRATTVRLAQALARTSTATDAAPPDEREWLPGADASALAVSVAPEPAAAPAADP
jgi:soluble lytic murein transglycosylase-like protein